MFQKFFSKEEPSLSLMLEQTLHLVYLFCCQLKYLHLLRDFLNTWQRSWCLIKFLENGLIFETVFASVSFLKSMNIFFFLFISGLLLVISYSAQHLFSGAYVNSTHIHTYSHTNIRIRLPFQWLRQSSKKILVLCQRDFITKVKPVIVLFLCSLPMHFHCFSIKHCCK